MSVQAVPMPDAHSEAHDILGADDRDRARPDDHVLQVASLPVAMGGMVKSFGVPPTTVATGIVAYSMLVAGFVMLGAKLCQRYGAARVFRAAVVVFCISQMRDDIQPDCNADDHGPSALRGGRLP